MKNENLMRIDDVETLSIPPLRIDTFFVAPQQRVSLGVGKSSTINSETISFWFLLFVFVVHLETFREDAADDRKLNKNVGFFWLLDD